MSIESQLKEQAALEADRRLSRLSSLEQKMDRLRGELADVEKAVAAAKEASERLAMYQPKVGNDYTCFYCMLDNKIVSKLYAMGGGTDTEEYLKCPVCKSEFTISI
jgi:hypothetical protein